AVLDKMMLGQPYRVVAHLLGLDCQFNVAAIEVRVTKFITIGIAKRHEQSEVHRPFSFQPGNDPWTPRQRGAHQGSNTLSSTLWQMARGSLSVVASKRSRHRPAAGM